MPVPLLDLRAQYATIKHDVDRAMKQVVDDQLFILGPTVERLEQAVALRKEGCELLLVHEADFWDAIA